MTTAEHDPSGSHPAQDVTAQQPRFAQPEAVRWAAATDLGLKRETNEDAFVAHFPVFAVADGMGGHLAGEVASEMAIDTLFDHFADQPAAVHIDDVTASVKMANLAIFRESRAVASRQGMGTTLTAMVQLDADHLGLVNVGDSRAYLLREGRMRRVSVDHSYVQELLNRGEIRPNEARTHPNRNIVTRALGVEPTIDVDAWIHPMVRGDRFLLCSDGLSDYVLDERIEAALNLHDDPTIAAHRLVELALQAGGGDNVTVLVFDVLDGLDPKGPLPEPTAFIPFVPPAEPDPVSGEIPITRRIPADAAPVDAADITGVITRRPVETAPLDATRPLTGAAPPRAGRSRSARKLSLATVLFIALIAGVFVAAFVATAAYARSGYFVGFDTQDNVAIFKGRPGGVLWFDPTVAQRSDISRSELIGEGPLQVEEQPTFDDIERASRFVNGLQTKAPVGTPDPAPPQTAPPLSTVAPSTTQP